jgi:membrane protein implicated in regulation of membrane protease activity
VLGAWLAGVMGIAVRGSSGQWLVSLAGSVLLVWLVRTVAERRRQRRPGRA